MASLVAAATSASAGDWPGFRGPDVTGQSNETGVFSELGSLRLDVVWTSAIGSGYSGVAVVAGRPAGRGRVVTMFSDGDSDVAAAFDVRTGKEVWRFAFEKTYAGIDGAHTGPIATPLIAGGRVYGLGAGGRLFALDLKSGSLIWSTQLVEEHKASKPYYGFATSPVLVSGVLVVQIGSKDGAIAGFDPNDGKRLWTSCEDTVGYQSPLPYASGGTSGVLAAGRKKLVFVDPTGGSIIWEHEHGGGGTPGIANLTPVPAGENRLFLAHKNDASTVIELKRGEGDPTWDTLWEDRSIRNSYNVPVYHDGYIYAYSARFLTCVDVETGKPKWRSRKPGDGFLSLVDGHLVIVTKVGGVHVAKASPKGYDEIASVNVLNDLAWAHPSFADGHIYVRGLDGLAKIAIRSDVVTSTPSVAAPDALLRGTKFGRFLSTLQAANDKASAVERFLRSQKQFPLVERTDIVHFIYHGRAEDLAVAGDLWGARRERPMKRFPGTDLFYYSVKLEPDARANYMFIRDYKTITDPRNARKTTTTVFDSEMDLASGDEETEMSWFAIPEWKMPEYLERGGQGRSGKVENHDFESTILESEGNKKKIEFDVYLPSGYAVGKQRYPVVYAHNGKAARLRGMIPRMLDHLSGKRIRPVIVVFINFEPPFGQKGYNEMVVKELIPLVDKNFRTVASADSRAHYGTGSAGLLAMLCAFQHPDAAAKVAVQSPFLWEPMITAIEAAIPNANEHTVQIYLDWGKYDLRSPHENWDVTKATRELGEVLKKKGFPFTGGEVNDGTGWSSWRNRVDRVFETLFPQQPTG